MRSVMLCGCVVVLCACAGRAASSDASDGVVLTADEAAAALEKCCGDSAMGVGLRIAGDYKEPSITTRAFTPAQFWLAVQPMAEYARFDVADVGRSPQGAPLRTITIGSGPVTVLLWSQMTGNESTGTQALADMLRWFANTRAEDRDVALRERLLDGLTIVLMPIVNPDAASVSAASSGDINNVVNLPATSLSASAAAALGTVQSKLQPDFAIGLLDHGARAAASDSVTSDVITLATDVYAAASVEKDSDNNSVGNSGSDQPARLLAATLTKSFLTELPGRVVRHPDALTQRVFGDATQRSRMSAVLVTSGDLEADPQKQRLRAVHVAALLSALDALATGAYQGARTEVYEQLPRRAPS